MTRENQNTAPMKINTHFSLNGNPRFDVTDHEKILPATVGAIALLKQTTGVNDCWNLYTIIVDKQPYGPV